MKCLFDLEMDPSIFHNNGQSLLLLAADSAAETAKSTILCLLEHGADIDL